MTKLLTQTLLVAALACASAMALSQATPPASRGQLLYTTHCKECQP